MKLDTLVLVIVCVVVGTVGTFWLSVVLLAALKVPFVLLALLPAALAGYIILRLVRERLSDPEEDHYDRMDH